MNIHQLSSPARTSLCLALAATLGLSGCETPGQTALLGAASGAAVGGALHGRGRDALAGAAIGAGAGYVAGKVAQDQRRRAYDQGYYDSRYARHHSDGYYDRYGYWHSY